VWKTEEFMPFALTLKFERSGYGGRGKHIFKTDNPTGRPELDDAVEIPIFFK